DRHAPDRVPDHLLLHRLLHDRVHDGRGGECGHGHPRGPGPMMPIMLVVMVPMLLMMPIIYNPNGKMAAVMSFLPPISPFVMVLRLSSSQPPPMWQAFVAIGIGIVTVYLALKGAAKVFRIGVLMYGKPPNVATLIKWIRMA